MSIRSRAMHAALVAFMVAGVIVATSGPASAATIVEGYARGEAASVSSPLTATTVHLSQAISETDSDGLGVGTNVAHGTAKPAEVVVDGVTTTRVADSETSAPPPSTDSDGVPGVDVPGVLTASALSSGSSADTLPRSTNAARVAQANALSLLTTGVVTGASESRRAGDDSLSTAQAEVASASLTVSGLLVSVTAAQASASAVATGIDPSLPGGSQGKILNCIVLEVKVGTMKYVNVPCDGKELSPLPAVVSVKTGTPKTSATATTAAASVDALVITIPATKQKIFLGSVEVRAGLGQAVTASPCAFPARPTASGAALGDVTRVNDLVANVQADVALSQAKIDEAGVNGGPKSATADGMIGQVSQAVVPVLTQVVDTHATAPPPQSDTTTVASATIGTTLKATTAKTDASASANPDGTAPTAHADATTASAGLNLGSPLITINSTTVASDATTTRNPGDVTSQASAKVQDVTGTIAGLPLTVQALQSTATASANGIPGGASAATTFKILKFQLGTLSVNATPPAGTTYDVVSGLTLVRITFGAGGPATIGGDGTFASASVDAVRIQVLPTGGGSAVETVLISHSEASAKVPSISSTLFVSKKVAVAFDDPRDFVDGPVTVAPGQKITYIICFANLGTTPLSNVVITDPLDGNLLRPFDALFPLPPNTAIVGGTPYSGSTLGGTLTSSPFTLAAGQTGSIQVTMEVVGTAAVGTVINNSATLSFSGGSKQSNNVVVNVGYSRNSPRLTGPITSTSFDANSRILTVNFLAQNAPQAGTAYGAEVVTVATTNGATPLTTFPIALGDIAPGGSQPFTVTFYIPNGVSSFAYDLLFRAKGSDGHTYMFD